MFDNVVELIKMQLQSNQFLTGGAVLGIIGGILVYLRRLPSQLFGLIKRRFVFEVEILNAETPFKWILTLFKYMDYAKRSNKLLLSWINDDDEYDDSKKSIIFSPGIGRHIFRHNGVLFWVYRSRNNESGTYERQFESLTISTFKFWKSRLIDMIYDGKKLYENVDNNIAIYIPDGIYWEKTGKIATRNINSIILDNGVMEDIIGDLDGFINKNEQYYTKYGIPYKRGYMFSGVSGSGKTSTIVALASYFNKNIYYIDLNSGKTDNSALQTLLANVPKYEFVVIEDIDISPAVCRTNKNIKTSNNLKTITINGLLNSLDGIGYANGRIIFITTNKPDEIDSALLRPGRVDKHIKFEYATKKQVEKLFNMFGVDGNCMEMAMKKENITMAEVQQIAMVEFNKKLDGKED